HRSSVSCPEVGPPPYHRFLATAESGGARSKHDTQLAAAAATATEILIFRTPAWTGTPGGGQKAVSREHLRERVSTERPRPARGTHQDTFST
ncbi:unnamed protein product, partial [Pylaiella littoralis]